MDQLVKEDGDAVGPRVLRELGDTAEVEDNPVPLGIVLAKVTAAVELRPALKGLGWGLQDLWGWPIRDRPVRQLGQVSDQLGEVIGYPPF
jgi:hypothetical protein